MAKLKNGWDVDPKDRIDPSSDPGPHLRELAQCAEDGIPVRPALAAWICAVHAKLVLRQSGAGGRPTFDSPEMREQAVRDILRLRATGVSEKQAIATVRQQLGLRATPSALYDYLSAHKSKRREEFEADFESSRRIAMSQFKELLQQGATHEEALSKVSSIRDWPTRTRTHGEDLERWLREAAYELAIGRTAG